ncbi:MAG TPA: fused MFS/spermidine synthase [Povalibacter sp.]|uniref:fused MFS/spermidine synthase n=1 Tax=Povalibacter sp. TaxID=1962978 RepID=UPI002CD22EAA|nr:fused MFS/spermidine synthase [Povalibacter sp.]HMN45495.1 fused MFS/spermidine synthase [Povalibacter sp.]
MKRKHRPTDPPPSTSPAAAATLLPSSLLFLSGAAALIYQLLWIKQLSLIVGVDVYAITIAISAFFAGLAVGGIVFGRWADRLSRPYLLYAALEVAVAILGIAATQSLAHSAAFFARAEGFVGPLAWLVPFLQVGIPATLMGGTVPVLVRAATRDSQQLARVGGRLYGANTAGAIIGALLPVFLLIPAFGVRGAAMVAAGLNLLAAAGAGLAARCGREEKKEGGVFSPPPRSGGGPGRGRLFVERTPPARLALLLYAISGGIALGYEVIWSQVVVQWTSTRSFAFAITLATYLFGWAIGSRAYAKRAATTGNPWGEFGLLIALAGVIAFLAVFSLGAWLRPLQTDNATLAFHLTNSEALAMTIRFATATLWIVLAPTILLGAAFPLALRIVAGEDRVGADTGSVIAWNTAGGIAGTVLAGFVLVPLLGVERSLSAMAIGGCILGVVAVLHGSSAGVVARWATFACGVIAVAGAVVMRPDHLARQLADYRRGELVFFKSGAGGTVAVIEQQSDNRRLRRLYVDAVSNSGDSMTSQRYMRLQSLLPLIVHNGEPRSALVIGMGTGITAGALLDYPPLEKRVVAELLPEVVEASTLFDGNRQVAGDPRTQIRLRDGRRELLRSEERYDLITLEPPPPSAAGIVNLYSSDFYRLAAQRLNEHGLLAQWLPLPTQVETDTQSLMRSFLDVFPYATLWTTELHEMLLIGSHEPIGLDAERIAARFSQPEVAAALQEIGVMSAADLLGTWVTGREGMERYAGAARPVTDDDPRIEYGPWVMPGEIVTVLPRLLALQTEPPLVNAAPDLPAEIVRSRDRLHRFYIAGLHAYRGERDRWARALDSVITEDPRNAYYRWIAGGRQ